MRVLTEAKGMKRKANSSGKKDSRTCCLDVRMGKKECHNL